MSGKVSVIIPVYNKEKHIEKCLDSVLNQTYNNLEIIIIDDASTDSSSSIVENIEDKRIKIISLPENKGVSTARNKGIEFSTGDYICFLDADDFWVLNKIERQVKFIESNNYSFIYSGYDYLKKGKRRKAKVPKSLNYNQLLKNHAIFTSTVMLNMKHLKKEEIFMPNIEIGQDYGTWWSILKKGITAYGITETLAIYRVGEKSLSSNKIKAVDGTWNLFGKENLNFIKRLYCFMCYGANAIKRRVNI